MLNEAPGEAAGPVHELEIKHVLIVDDDVDLAESLKALLESYDYMVSTALNGVEALRVVLEWELDAILCDMMMPSMAGDMFYKAVERVKPHLCSRFIFITGFEGHPKFTPFLEEIHAEVLYKPITMEKLLESLEQVFLRHRSH